MSTDGCSATCAVETGYVCNGGTPDFADECEEICADGKDYWNYECDVGGGN